jgi:hypothetical protein
MSAFFDSLKSDLLDRRLTPLLALLGAALLGAIVYAALAGGSSSPAPTAPSATPKTPGIAVSAVTTTAKPAVAETTSGAAQQTGGHSRNPFAPLPGAKSTAATTAPSGASSTAAATSSGEGSSSTSPSGPSEAETSSPVQTAPSQTGGTNTEQTKKTTKPSKAYKVSILFGTAPAGAPPLTAGLTSYERLQRQQPLPSAKEPLIVFRGVVVGGKSVTFTLVGEAILRGAAVCRPSASQCKAIDLKAGDSEELEYVPLGGTAVTYELYVVNIEAVKAKAGRSASAASAADPASAPTGESKAGRAILRAAGLTALPGLRYSADGSVLVFKQPEHMLATRAHAAAWGVASY